MRYDIVGRQAPQHLQRMLARRYGRNAFGEPLFRLVWAPARLERSGGLWTDWRGGHAVRGQGLLRRVAEIRWVRKYPGEVCWLLEQWTPPQAYGTPETWGQPIELGGTILATDRGPVATLGPYPQFGDYEDLGARMYWYPSERHLTLAIEAVVRKRAAAGGNAKQRVLASVNRAQERELLRDAAFDHFCREVLDDTAPAFGGAPMAGYGGKRRPSLITLAESIGIRQHPY